MSRLICASVDLLEGGDGLRFQVDTPAGAAQAFVLRWRGGVHAFYNRCAHVPVELDWNPGKFLTENGEYLVCAMHGALFEPDGGVCVGGPCAGRALEALTVSERDGNVYLEDF